MSWIVDAETTDDLLALIPAINDRFRELHDAIWNASDADPIVLELCRLRVAQLVGSKADLAVRYGAARDAGLTGRKVEQLGDWPVSDLFDARERAALNLAEKYVIDPHSVTDADCAELNRHFTAEALAAMTTALAVFDAMARFRVALEATAAAGTVVAVGPASPLP